MRTGSDELLKKISSRKNQYKKEETISTNNPLEPCPKCSALREGKSCSPLMYIDTHAICDYWFNIQKQEVQKQFNFC
jgi:hypothetical protein